MLTKLTVRQIINLGLWDKVCKYKGINSWALNEGLIEDDEVIEFDSEFRKESKLYNPILIINPQNEKEKLFTYSIKCKREWDGKFYGMIFAENKEKAIEKLYEKYEHEDLDSILESRVNEINISEFDDGIFEIDMHRE